MQGPTCIAYVYSLNSDLWKSKKSNKGHICLVFAVLSNHVCFSRFLELIFQRPRFRAVREGQYRFPHLCHLQNYGYLEFALSYYGYCIPYLKFMFHFNFRRRQIWGPQGGVTQGPTCFAFAYSKSLRFVLSNEIGLNWYLENTMTPIGLHKHYSKGELSKISRMDKGRLVLKGLSGPFCVWNDQCRYPHACHLQFHVY